MTTDNAHFRTGFTFKQFHVAHEGCAMKVGTDAILLGAWVPLGGATRVLDIGTGSGILSLMLAQRAHGPILIDALDIDKGAILQAQKNVQHSPWPNSIHCHHCPLQDHKSAPYDLIISNPPYFRPGQILGSPTRQWARHTEQLPHDQLLSNATRLSHTDSVLALVLPTQTGQGITQVAPAAGWHLNACCTVFPTTTKAPNRQMLLFRHAPPAKTDQTELTIRQPDGTYSPAFTHLCKDFYLKM